MNNDIQKDATSSGELAPRMTEQSITQEQPIVNDYDIDAFLEKRAEFITKVNKIMIEGKDYHVIQGKKSLAKGGAEKIASIFGWTAVFQKDQEVIDSFKDLSGLVAFVCNLTKGEQLVGQGRGAANLAKNGGDPNKTIKMAQKSAFIDAVLRASGLSDFFTQDLGPEDEGKTYNHITVPQATPKQKEFIKSLMEQKGYIMEDLADNGIIPGQTPPSEAIEFLKQAKSKVLPNGNAIISTGNADEEAMYSGDENEPEAVNDSPAKAAMKAGMEKVRNR